MFAGNLSTQEIKKYTDCIALIPFGAFEQHGLWMPLMTDSYIAESLAQRIEAQLPKKVLLFPTLWFGDSIEHRGFAGTLSVKAVTMMQTLEELFLWLNDTGFKRGILYNAHGGNVHLSNTICEEFCRGHNFKIKHVYAYTKAMREKSKELFGVAETHAGSSEMSLLYALRPDLLKTKKTKFKNPSLYTGGGQLSLYETRELSRSGILQSTETIELDVKKGEQLAQIMVEDAITTLKQFL